jgi:hypothetical protein
VDDPRHAQLVATYARDQAENSVVPIAAAQVALCVCAIGLFALNVGVKDYGLAVLWAVVLALNVASLVRLRGRRRRLLRAADRNERRAAPVR